MLSPTSPRARVPELLGLAALVAVCIATPAAADTPIVPEDGLWKSDGTINSLSCGEASAMMRSMLENNLKTAKPARVSWGGTFGGDAFQTAWLKANPDPEAQDLAWSADGANVRVAEMSQDGMNSVARMELLTPRRFTLDWTFKAPSGMGPCTWSITQDVRKIAD